MDQVQTGKLIKKLRLDRGLTQLQLAQKLGVSDRTVSKWERGAGFPDVEFLASISSLFSLDLRALLDGVLPQKEKDVKNMKNLNFYHCPICGNTITSTTSTSIYCCGENLNSLDMKKAESDRKLNVQIIENDYYINSEHKMTKDDYISFVALLTADTIILKNQYPEWPLSLRIPNIGHGKLIWYSIKDGLFYQII